MIRQQTEDSMNVLVKEYQQLSTDLAASMHVVTRFKPESAGNHARSFPDTVPDVPDCIGGRPNPLLKARDRRHPDEIKIDGGTTTMRPLRIFSQVETTPESIRVFIGGVSHCYNNILMGIWGHASLIGMMIEKSDPFQNWLTELEDLIQNGSNLMNLLYGYIAERRSATRKLRLKQLRIEMDAYHENFVPGHDFSVIEECICELSPSTARSQIYARVARVVKRMQFLVAQQRSLIDDKAIRVTKAKAHLEKIDVLIQRGARLIIDLKYSAGIRIPIKQSMDLRSLVQSKVDDILRRHPGLGLTWTEKTPMPRIDMDWYQIGYAVDHLLKNAVEAASASGKITIALNTFHSEAPHDRCGVHMLRNYAVLTIRDNGKGMTTAFLSKIFFPFVTGIKGQGRQGLGLSAAAGIVRAHGGYMQVRSQPGMGFAVKMYLPAG